MKRKDIKMLIRKTALQDMPDVFDRIDLNLVNNDSRTHVDKAPRIVFNFTKALKFASIVLLLGITSVFVYSQMLNPSSEVMAMETDAELIGFPAISGANLINSMQTLDLSQQIFLPLEIGSGTLLPEEELDTLNLYLNAMETMLGDKNDLSYIITENADNEYRYLLEYQTIDLLGTSLTYQMHYNLVAQDGNENIMIMEGVILIGDNEYVLNGTYRVNGSVSNMKLKVMIDAENYILIEDLTTNGNQIFSYKSYQNGLLTDSVRIGLSLTESRIVGNLKIISDDTTVEYRIKRNDIEDAMEGMTITYQYQKGSVSETGIIDVDIESVVAGEYEYCYDIRTTGSGNMMMEYRAIRGNKATQDSIPGNNNHPGNGRD
jgi:hypothetical protein